MVAKGKEAQAMAMVIKDEGGKAGRCGQGATSGLVLMCLYLGAATAASASFVLGLMQTAGGCYCLPPIANSFGDPLSLRQGLGAVCDLLTYGSVSVAVLCVTLILVTYCRPQHPRWSVVQLTLTVLMCVVSASCATALTIDFLLWCHTLRNTVGESSCESAAATYDAIHRTNMTSSFFLMEWQQETQWAVVPFLMCAVIVLSTLLSTSAGRPQARYRPVHPPHFSHSGHEASACLLVPETSLAHPTSLKRKDTRLQID